MNLKTKRLELILQTPDQVRQWIETLPQDVKQEISQEWLSRLNSATGPDIWTCTFTTTKRDDGESIGICGFKGPPNENGMVEISYGIDSPHQNVGFATESAKALVELATTIDSVLTVRANTKSDNAASERVLAKLGFEFQGQFTEPKDGLVNRWEIRTASEPLQEKAPTTHGENLE